MIIITTVGTSLITNLLKEDSQEIHKKKFSTDLRNKIYNGDLEKETTPLKEALLYTIVNHDRDNQYGVNLNASAEIKSICKIANGKPATVYLLCTDTFMSNYAGEKIKEYLNGKEGLVVNHNGRVKGLKIDNPEEFEKTGFENLLDELEKIKKENKLKNGEVVLNISGGYKALVPFLTIYAQIENIPLKYLYENSDQPVSISGIPLSFDWSLAEAYYEYLQNTDLLSQAPDVLINSLEASGFIHTDHSLTALGKMLKKYIEKYLPQRASVVGWYMEHKLFESFFRAPFRDYRVKSIGREFYYDPDIHNTYFEKKKDGLVRIEIDLELENSEGNAFWIECKSFGQKGKVMKQIEKALEFNLKWLKSNMKEVGVFIYKYPFQKLPYHFYEKFAEDLLKKYEVKLIVFSWDIPYSFDKNSINYKAIFETKLELKHLSVTEYS